MPEILFASNSISHFPGSVVSNELWTYDSNRVPYSINTPPGTPGGSPEFKASTSGETWFHFVMGSTTWSNNRTERILEVNDINGELIFYFGYDSSGDDGFYADFRTGGQIIIEQEFLPMYGGQTKTFDIQLKWDGINATMRIYYNEILVIERTVAESAQLQPRFMIIGGGTDPQYWSEIIIADGDTRNARLDLLRPVSQGAYSDWLGPVGYLSDDDPTTGMTTLAANQKQSTNLTPYGGALNISNVVQVTTTVRGINSPDLIRHLIRMSVTDYESIDYSVPFEKDYQVTDWNVNPATGQPWTGSDLEIAEFGFISDETPP